jgi:hypothetical protein
VISSAKFPTVLQKTYLTDRYIDRHILEQSMRKFLTVTLVFALALAVSPVNLLALPTAIPQTGSVNGTAQDANKNPLANAKVKLMQGNTEVASQTSATNGTFSFTGVGPGTYTIQITNIINGVETVVGTASVTVAVGVTATITVATTVAAAAVAAGSAGGILSLTSLLVLGGIAGGAAVAYKIVASSSQ